MRKIIVARSNCEYEWSCSKRKEGKKERQVQ